MNTQPLWLRILRNPLARIVQFALLFIGFYWVIGKLMPSSELRLRALLDANAQVVALQGLRSCLPFILAYWTLVRVIEGRRVEEFAPRRLLPQLSLGLAVGFGLMVATAGLMALLGSYHVSGVNWQANLLGPLVVMAIVPGITEEIVFRGVLYRIVEDGLGSWMSLLLSGLLFGAVHLGNPNASMWSSTAIAIEAGLLLGLAYAWSRSMWLVIGLHAAWNFTQGAVLGISVSGIDAKGLLVAKTDGAELISGGAFGAEASMLTVLLSLGLSAWFARGALARGQIRPPFWRRAKA